MATEIQILDETIELEQLNSTVDSTENLLEVQCQSTPRQFKKTNKIQSPTVKSPVSSQASSSKISDIFIVKQNVEPATRQFKPVPAPRNLKVFKHTKTNLSPESGKTIKELSETIDTVSGDAQSIFSLKSDTLSYRERLRNRFLAVKKQAGESVTQIQDSNREARRNKKKSLDSTDSLIENEDTVINAELDKYEKSKLRWSNEEFSAHDFFCGVDEKEPDNNESADLLKKKIKNKSVEELEKDAMEDEDNSNKHSLNEFVTVNNLDTDIIQYLPPEILDIPSYEQLIFKSTKRNSVKCKSKNVDCDFEPRHLEEEGIFKGKRPYIPEAQLTSLQDRLSFEENREWFGPDGQLNILPDPRLDKWFKPFHSDMKTRDFLHEYSPPTLYEPTENMVDTSDKTLEIILHSLTLKHHPLFTKEHVIARKLCTLFENYQNTVSVNACFIYSKKLEVLRAAKDRLATQLQASGDVSDVQTTRHRKCVSEIKEVREKMYKASKDERQLKKSILLVWKALKNVRKTQKYSSTSVQLIINRENVDYEHEIHVWDRNISEEMSEIAEEYEANFYTEMQQYKQELQVWKALKEQLNKNDAQGDIEEMLPEKPCKPKRNCNVDEIKYEITEKCNGCLKPPGEPLIEFELKSENDMVEEISSPKEVLRRNILRTTQIFVKILYNKREICKSRYIILDNNFVCDFNEQISVRILQGSHSLNLEIYEQSGTMSKKILAAFSLHIPKFNSITDADIMTQTFMNKEIIASNHSGIGTGMKINEVMSTNDLDVVDNEEQLFCNGILTYNLGWATESARPSVPRRVPSTRQVRPKNVDLDSLGEWMKSGPDPQDPKNAILFDYIRNVDINVDENKDYFRLDPGGEPFVFCDDDEIEYNPRFRLLQLRDNDEPEFKGVVVPNRIKEIPPDAFDSYEKRTREERVGTGGHLNGLFDENIDPQRKRANQYLEQTENRIVQLNKIAERRITLRDVINEEIVPSIGSLGLTFMNWIQPKRPLRPARKPIKKIQAAVTLKDMKVMANIIGAIQVPTRNDSESASTSKSEHMSVISVRPFVVVSFQGVCVRTTVAEGPNPIWNQEFILPLRNTSTSLTACSLQNIKDSLVFNLYDETVDDLIVDDRVRDTNIHQHLGCNWLGRFEIPFTTLLSSNRIEGSFKINLPPILLGYERQSIKAFQVSGEPFTQKIDTFLTVFITLQPTFSNLLQHVKNELESIEVKYVEQFITNWQTQFNALYPHRQFSAFATNINGERGCITRYVKPIRLPQLDCDTRDITELQCAKYVSLIPFRENSAAGLIPDIWLTAEQVLTLMMGSIKDHAVLLSAYLMTLGVKSWLLLGYGMPYGYTAYVLTRETNAAGYNYYVYDVRTAQKYNVYDNTCPLQKVFCVVNDENVWGNIQEEARLHLTKFDFTKSSDWLQLFGREASAPTSSVQPSNELYRESPAVLLLQQRIERKLRKKIVKWRKSSLTTWNRYCSVILKRLLPKLEECNMQHNNFNSPEHMAELQNLLSTYRIRGFAINFPYGRITRIIDFIEETGIHLNENPNLEFALGVYVKSYVNNAVVVWLYLVTLVRRT